MKIITGENNRILKVAVPKDRRFKIKELTVMTGFKKTILLTILNEHLKMNEVQGGFQNFFPMYKVMKSEVLY